MTVGYGPLYVVDGPRPSAPRFGLLTAATIVPEDNDHWINGVAVRPFPSGNAGTFDPCDDSGTSPNEKGTGDPITVGEFGALTVYFAETCTARGIVTNDDFRARAVVSMASREGRAVEFEFWAGITLPSTPHLSDTNAVLLNAGAVTDVFNGLALLEDAIAATGVGGVIHAPWATVSVWSSNYQVFRDGANLVTALGTLVVPGAGYDPAVGPDNGAVPTGTEAWAYATGPVEVRRSDMFLVPGELAQALDRENNVVTYRAERYYVTTWDRTLQAAVLIDRCQVGCVAAP